MYGIPLKVERIERKRDKYNDSIASVDYARFFRSTREIGRARAYGRPFLALGGNISVRGAVYRHNLA